MEKGVWGHRPVLEGGREGGGGGVRPFPFSTENSHIVAYSPPSLLQLKSVKRLILWDLQQHINFFYLS